MRPVVDDDGCNDSSHDGDGDNGVDDDDGVGKQVVDVSVLLHW